MVLGLIELIQILALSFRVRGKNFSLIKNYITTEKELLAVVYALDKFRAYLVGSDIIIFTDHSALKYLFTKHNAKARLIRWVLLLLDFNLQIKDKKVISTQKVLF